MPVGRRHRQPVCPGPVLHPSGPAGGGKCGGCGGGMPGQGRTGGGHGRRRAAAAQQTEGLRFCGDQTGIPLGTGQRRGRIQALRHFPGGPDERLSADGRESCPEAGGTVPDSGILRRPLRQRQEGPQRSDELAAGRIGGRGFCGNAHFLCGGLPGFHPAAHGHFAGIDDGPGFDRGPELRFAQFRPDGL